MNAKREIIISELKNHLIKNYGNSVKEVILFGSRTREDYTVFSDYDVLIVLNNDYSGKDENEILDLCYEMNLKHDILLDVHIISDKELNSQRGKQPFFEKAIKSGIYA